jgi:hypothetical protein
LKQAGEVVEAPDPVKRPAGAIQPPGGAARGSS